jgi:hypothetical protein
VPREKSRASAAVIEVAMKLPNARQVVVDRRKITEYLLNPTHPDNGGKAKFFVELGFGIEKWEVFAQALREMALH